MEHMYNNFLIGSQLKLAFNNLRSIENKRIKQKIYKALKRLKRQKQLWLVPVHNKAKKKTNKRDSNAP